MFNWAADPPLATAFSPTLLAADLASVCHSGPHDLPVVLRVNYRWLRAWLFNAIPIALALLLPWAPAFAATVPGTTGSSRAIWALGLRNPSPWPCNPCTHTVT